MIPSTSSYPLLAAATTRAMAALALGVMYGRRPAVLATLAAPGTCTSIQEMLAWAATTVATVTLCAGLLHRTYNPPKPKSYPPQVCHPAHPKRITFLYAS